MRLGKVRKGRSEREHVPTITSEWVNEHLYVLTPRDKEMLKLLAKFPVMTIDHLVALTPKSQFVSGKSMNPFYENEQGHKVCRDRVRRLFDYHFVNKFSPRLGLGEGTAPQYIWLDRAGYKLLNVQGRPPKTLTIEYLHHAKILDTYITFIELERQGIIEIDYLEVCYAYKPKTCNIEPDIIICFRKGNYGYKYLVEVDTGEKKESDELNKIDKYRDWELSGQWIREEWGEHYKRRFPTVLYVFSGESRKTSRRITMFKKRADDTQCKYDGLLLTSLQEKLLTLQS